jgi:hypothetical protein
MRVGTDLYSTNDGAGRRLDEEIGSPRGLKGFEHRSTAKLLGESFKPEKPLVTHGRNQEPSLTANPVDVARLKLQPLDLRRR